MKKDTSFYYFYNYPICKLETIKDKKKKTFEKNYGDGKIIREKQSQSMRRAFEKNKNEILKKKENKLV